jgi:hypothetical protein
MAAANLQAQPKLALDKTVVGAGGVVTAMVSDGQALAGDWLGLYDGTGGLVTSYRDWKYLNGTHAKPEAGGVANAAVTFTLPQTPGTYSLRLFNSGTFDVAATSAPILVTSPSLSVSATTGAGGRDGHRDRSKCSRQCRRLDRALRCRRRRQHLPGVEIPERIARQAGGREQQRPGRLRASLDSRRVRPSAVRGRDLRRRGDELAHHGHRLGRRHADAIDRHGQRDLGAAGRESHGDHCRRARHLGDWIGLFDVNGGVTNYLQWQYLNGTQSSRARAARRRRRSSRCAAVAGTYNLRLFANKLLHRGHEPSITSQANRHPRQRHGQRGRNGDGEYRERPGRPGDWSAHTRTAPSPSPSVGILNGSQVKPAAGVSSAAVSFVAPAAPGTWQRQALRPAATSLLASSPSFVVP